MASHMATGLACGGPLGHNRRPRGKGDLNRGLRWPRTDVMKYLALLLFVIFVLGLLIEALKSNGGAEEKRVSLTHRFKDLGGRIHLTMGVVAALIVGVLILRLILQVARNW